MTYFYEYLNHKDDGKYYRFRDIGDVLSSDSGFNSGMIQAWRVWKLEDDAVTFVKNRLTGIMTAVDEKEFLMVQLMATPLD
jgi:hypothetical protein